MAGPIRTFFDFLAKMGLSIRDDPPKTVQLEGRRWGAEAGGLTLSVAVENGVASVVLRNVYAHPVTVQATDFASWFDLDLTDANGEMVLPTPFGRQLRRSQTALIYRTLTIAPDHPIEAQIPLRPLYELTPGRSCQIEVRCQLQAGLSIISNSFLFVVKEN